VRKENTSLMDWFGMRKSPDFTKARWLGGLLSVVISLVLFVAAGGTLFRFVEAILTGGENSAALRNTGLAWRRWSAFLSWCGDQLWLRSKLMLPSKAKSLTGSTKPC
jgi:hypothetical protein